MAKNEFSVWIPSGEAGKLPIREDSPRDCPGMDYDTRNCTMRPDFVLHFLVNQSGLPGLADDIIVTVCREHLAEEMHQALSTRFLVGAVTVSAYDGK
jgi:hypothetical protein